VERKPLPEIFRTDGYATAGFTGGGFMSQKWGFPIGFDTYFMFQQPPPVPDRCSPDRFDGTQVFDLAERWLRERAKAPFFLFVHTYEVHDRCPVQPPGIGPFAQWPNPGPERLAKVTDYYGELIARADGLVGGLLRTLDELGLTDSTLVMVMSDHGDGFWEHGFGGHGCPYKPYEEIVRVPLILRYPKVVGQRGKIDQPVSLIDLAPTALDLMTLPPAAWMPGKPLPGLGLAGATPPETPLMIGCDDMLAVRIGDRKLITSKKSAFPDEVYDLRKDPGERNELTADKATAELRKQAAAYWGLGTGQFESENALDELDEKTRERLRALGYIQ
jgi:arylsulfatase A-like enzyme